MTPEGTDSEAHFPMAIWVLVGEDLNDGGFIQGSGRPWLPEVKRWFPKPKLPQDIAEGSQGN